MKRLTKAGIVLFSGLALGAAAVHPDNPVYLDVEENDDQVEIRVVGEAKAEIHGSYDLETINGTGNRSRQRGTVHLSPGKAVTLATVRVGDAAGTGVRATLTVTLHGIKPYTVEFTSGE